MRNLLSTIAIVCLCAWNAFAQSYTISTYAGPAAPVAGAQAITQALDAPYAVVADGQGGVYVASLSLNRVLYVQSDGRLTIVAGTGTPGFSGDGGPATEAQLNEPRGLAVDASGNIYISDTQNHRVRRVTPNGIINTIAGTGTPGFSGDGGRPPAAQLNSPRGLAVDPAGNLYIGDAFNLRVRSVTAAGAMTTVAGNGLSGFAGDGGSAIAALLGFGFESVAVDANGVLYIADLSNNRIRRVVRGIIQTVAGTGTSGFSGDGGPATAAQLFLPAAVSVAGGNLYITDRSNQRIRIVDSAGNISTVAGTGLFGFVGDGGPAMNARLSNPLGVSADGLGNIFIADFSSNRVRRVSSNGVIDTFVGNGTAGYSGDGGPATLALFSTPYGIATDLEGNLFIADLNNHRIRKVTPAGVITTVAGNGVAGFSGDGGPATSGQIRSPSDVAVDSSGNLYIADTGNFRVRRVTPNGTLSTFAGTGGSGYAGDDGPALSARFNSPVGLAVDRDGNVFIADLFNHRIRRVTPAGVISTVAGDGTQGFDGDGEAATNAQLNSPYGVTVDTAGTLFIADTVNHRIRRVGASGIIDTIVGTGIPGFSGDTNFAVAAQVNSPSGLSVDSEGNLFIADTGNNRIRKVDRAGGITTIAGFVTAGFRGDGGPANTAWLNLPRRVIATSTGNLFIADTINHRIRELSQPRLVAGAFTIADRGGVSLLSSGTAGPAVATGFASIEPDGGRTTPAGLAIFGFRQQGILVSEAAVPASSLIQSGRIYGEVRPNVNTGLALANPNYQDATITFFFTDQNGDSAQSSMTLAARSQVAAFLDQAPFDGPSSLAGSFTFNSSIPIAAIALRGFTNERSEFLLTTLPVIDLAGTVAGPLNLPHFADGAGWTTEVMLVNPGDSVVTGSIQFFSPSGQTIAVGLNGPSSYSIPPRSSRSVRTTGLPAITQTGWVKIVPAASSSTPAAFAVFSFRRNGIVVTEAGVPAVPAAAAIRLYAESFGNFSQGEAGSIQSGLAVANPSAAGINIFVEVQNLDGSTGLIGTLLVPANGQTSLYLNEIPGLQSMLTPYQGVLRLSSSTPFSVIGLRGRYNERGDPLITTTPPVNEGAPVSNTPAYFPHIADSGGYTTQFILFSGYARQTSTGVLRFFNQSGVALNLGFR